MLNKVIRKFKIAVTSSCSLRCAYCFVDKGAGQDVSREGSAAAIRLLVRSPGADKKLELYGGEPLLRFRRVRQIMDGARAEARAAGKSLSVSIATNGVAVSDEQLRFLRSRGAKLSVSFSGTDGVHDRFRKTRTGAGSFSRVVANLPRVFSTLGKDAVDAIFCVHPEGVGTMARDFEALMGLGFEHVNIEVVHGFAWKRRARREFSRQLDLIGEKVLSRIRSGGRIFLDTFFDFLDPGLKRFGACPFYRDLEMFPGGEYSFYPYPFVVRGEVERVAVGHAAQGLIERYRACRFEPRSRRCAGCREQYYVLRRIARGNEPYRERTRFLARLLSRILSEAKSAPAFQAYARELWARAGGRQ
ncbi:MAG: radical SAM protein [Elusimicrobiota bacterium]